MKAIIKRSGTSVEDHHLDLDVVVELGDYTKHYDNLIKEASLDEKEITEEQQETLITLMVERSFESKISEVIEKVVDSLDDTAVLEFGMPDVEVESMPLSREDLEKSPFHLKLQIPFELVALPMMESIEKAIESL